MSEEKSILGIITARGGSRGIPRKNIKPLAGKPLIAYTVEAVHQCKKLTRCIVSTEDDEIATIAKAYGADVPFMRPEGLAQDDTTSLAVVQHVVTALKDLGEEYDFVMILQPTSPLRTAEDIDASIQKILSTGADSVMGMVELSDFASQKFKVIEDDVIKPLLEPEGYLSAPRSVGRKVYKRNAAIYLTRTELLMQNDLFGAVSRPHIMPRERSVDVNDPFDWAVAELLLAGHTHG